MEKLTKLDISILTRSIQHLIKELENINHTLLLID